MLNTTHTDLPFLWGMMDTPQSSVQSRLQPSDGQPNVTNISVQKGKRKQDKNIHLLHAVRRLRCRFAAVLTTASALTARASWENIPDNLNSSSDAILTDMSWEKRSFWGQANVSERLLIGSLFSLAPKVLKFSRWEAGGVSSAGGGSTSMGSAFTFTFWYWASLLLSGKKEIKHCLEFNQLKQQYRTQIFIKPFSLTCNFHLKKNRIVTSF